MRSYRLSAGTLLARVNSLLAMPLFADFPTAHETQSTGSMHGRNLLALLRFWLSRE